MFILLFHFIPLHNLQIIMIDTLSFPNHSADSSASFTAENCIFLRSLPFSAESLKNFKRIFKGVVFFYLHDFLKIAFKSKNNTFFVIVVP